MSVVHTENPRERDPVAQAVRTCAERERDRQLKVLRQWLGDDHDLLAGDRAARGSVVEAARPPLAS